MSDIMDAARRSGLCISEMTVIGKHALGLSQDGGLYKWCGNRWVRMELSNIYSRGRRRLPRYAGHPESARSAHA